MASGFVDHLADVMADFGGIGFRPMFGGHGVYRGGIMIGLVAYETLYLKADEASVPLFAAEGLGPFVYEGKGKPVSMSYWRCPERCLDDPDEMRLWLDRAEAAARRAATAKAEKPPRKRKNPAASD